MPGADDIDITVDLNNQAEDAQPYHNTDLSVNRQVDVPSVLPDDKAPTEPPASLRDTLTDAFKGTEAPKVDAPPQAEVPSVPPLFLLLLPHMPLTSCLQDCPLAQLLPLLGHSPFAPTLSQSLPVRSDTL